MSEATLIIIDRCLLGTLINDQLFTDGIRVTHYRNVCFDPSSEVETLAKFDTFKINSDLSSQKAVEKCIVSDWLQSFYTVNTVSSWGASAIASGKYVEIISQLILTVYSSAGRGWEILLDLFRLLKSKHENVLNWMSTLTVLCFLRRQMDMSSRIVPQIRSH